MNTFEKKLNMIGENGLYSEDTDILQVNVGLKCNQNCSHCHLMASPKRNEMMEWKTMQSILDVIEDTTCNLVGIRGDTPGLSPHFLMLFLRVSWSDSLSLPPIISPRRGTSTSIDLTVFLSSFAFI